MKDKPSREVKHVDHGPRLFSNIIGKKKKHHLEKYLKVPCKTSNDGERRKQTDSKLGIYFVIWHWRVCSADLYYIVIELQISQCSEVEWTIFQICKLVFY